MIKIKGEEITCLLKNEIAGIGIKGNDLHISMKNGMFIEHSLNEGDVEVIFNEIFEELATEYRFLCCGKTLIRISEIMCVKRNDTLFTMTIKCEQFDVKVTYDSIEELDENFNIVISTVCYK